jgi:hypothetical protein
MGRRFAQIYADILMLQKIGMNLSFGNALLKSPLRPPFSKGGTGGFLQRPGAKARG